MIDIHVITCHATSSRLTLLLESFQELINHPCINQIKLICASDISFINEDLFSEGLWEEHISLIYPILARNIKVVNHGNKDMLLELLGSNPDRLFPRRPLRPAEKSLLHKHFKSFELVSCPTLVIEDDAHLLPGKANAIIELAYICERKNMYIDLGYLPGFSKGSFIRSGDLAGEYLETPIALTRTTTGYIVNKKISGRFISDYWKCSLPADLHHQLILSRTRTPGIWPRQQIIIGQSSSGRMASSIQ